MKLGSGLPFTMTALHDNLCNLGLTRKIMHRQAAKHDHALGVFTVLIFDLIFDFIFQKNGMKNGARNEVKND